MKSQSSLSASLAMLAPLVSSVALPQTTPSPLPVCEPISSFTMQMLWTVNGTDNWLSVNALGNGTSPAGLDVVGMPVSEFPGTPVVINGTNPLGSELRFNLTALREQAPDQTLTNATGLWTIYTGDVGEVEGEALPLHALPNATNDDFSVYNGTIRHQLTSADQNWYACNTTIAGTEYTRLSWGLAYENGTYPDGCVPTIVIQEYGFSDCGGLAAL